MDKASHDNTPEQTEEIINHEQFEEMRDLLAEDFAGLIQIYIADSEQRVAALRDAQQTNDNSNGFELAHALKGASANLGTTQLIALSDQLQSLCCKHRISEQAELIENIATALQRAKQEIHQRLEQ